jgi:hypothetical protein
LRMSLRIDPTRDARTCPVISRHIRAEIREQHRRKRSRSMPAIR